MKPAKKFFEIRVRTGALALMALILASGPLLGVSAAKDREPTFRYVGGTENIPEGCTGALQLTGGALGFECPQYQVTIPYSAIETMQYRADVRWRIRRMKVNWAVRPPRGGGQKNRYFTVVYRASGGLRVIVLEVSSDQMRPYLAEIDLQAGQRVEVQRHEDSWW